jgi:hypothetical protein
LIVHQAQRPGRLDEPVLGRVLRVWTIRQLVVELSDLDAEQGQHAAPAEVKRAYMWRKPGRVIRRH